MKIGTILPILVILSLTVIGCISLGNTSQLAPDSTSTADVSIKTDKSSYGTRGGRIIFITNNLDEPIYLIRNSDCEVLTIMKKINGTYVKIKDTPIGVRPCTSTEQAGASDFQIKAQSSSKLLGGFLAYDLHTGEPLPIAGEYKLLLNYSSKSETKTINGKAVTKGTPPFQQIESNEFEIRQE